MILDLQQAFTPDDIGEEVECALCRREHRLESVQASAATDGRDEIGLVCRECIEYFGRVNPDLFPTIEQYQALIERYPAPMFPSEEAMEASEQPTGDPRWPAYEASWIWRAPV